ncbi:MAG: hypothetical protein ABI222_03785 [Opitutaceae bacterium]
MKTTHFTLPAALLLAGLALPARAETHVSLNLQLGAPAPIVVRQAPPPVIIERQYNAPGPGYVWIAGHNVWRHNRWVWVGGTWMRPPQPGVIYVEGRWDGRSHNWIDSHWELPPPPPVLLPAPPDYNVEYVVGAPPPPPRQEIIVVRPGPSYVWIGGYWARHGRRQEWVAGRWEKPPHGRREWVAPRYEHRGKDYVFIQGSWR